MTQFYDWEWFTGEVPTGRVQVQTRSTTRILAEKWAVGAFWNWEIAPHDPEYIIAYRRVKEPVRGEVVLGWDGLTACKGVHKRDTHRLTLTTDDGALICGEYVEPGGAILKIETLG